MQSGDYSHYIFKELLFMSKLSVKGTADMDFTVDLFIVTITIRATAPSTGEVIQSGKKKTEQFLATMQDKLGIEPSCFKLETDSVKEEYNNKNTYSYTKKLSLEIKADLAALSQITSLLGELNNVEYNVDFDFSDEDEKVKQVIDAAISNSREKAELIASSLGKTIQGVDEINFDTPYGGKYRSLAKSVCVEDYPDLETMLKNPTKTITKSIYIDWIIE